MGAWLEHERLGFNYRMDEMSAALGVSQIGRLDNFLAKREHVAQMYTRAARGPRLGAAARGPPATSRMSWFVYVVTLAPDVDRDAVIGSLAAEGIPSRAYFSPHPPAALHPRALRHPRGHAPGHRGRRPPHHRSAVPQQPHGGAGGDASWVRWKRVVVRSVTTSIRRTAGSPTSRRASSGPRSRWGRPGGRGR